MSVSYKTFGKFSVQYTAYFYKPQLRFSHTSDPRDIALDITKVNSDYTLTLVCSML